jgi:hypothetical protein
VRVCAAEAGSWSGAMNKGVSSWTLAPTLSLRDYFGD